MATWNYIKVFEDGTQVSTSIQPVFGETSTTADYYLDNIWYNNSGVAYTTTFTYLPYKVLIDEQLNVLDYDKFDIPTLVEDYVKTKVTEADEYKGKQVCTAWCNFDGTTTPPTIRDSYNVSQVIRTSTGYYDIYFKNQMDNTTYAVSGVCANALNSISTRENVSKTADSFKIEVASVSPFADVSAIVYLQIFGGKN